MDEFFIMYSFAFFNVMLHYMREINFFSEMWMLIMLKKLWGEYINSQKCGCWCCWSERPRLVTSNAFLHTTVPNLIQNSRKGSIDFFLVKMILQQNKTTWNSSIKILVYSLYGVESHSILKKGILFSASKFARPKMLLSAFSMDFLSIFKFASAQTLISSSGFSTEWFSKNGIF